MMPSSSCPAFTLLRFTLVRSPAGVLTQERETLGTFADAITAFNTAKHRAWLAFCQLAQSAKTPNDPGWDLAVCDTEWGYDLRRNGQIVDRFWVHDRHEREAL